MNSTVQAGSIPKNKNTFYENTIKYFIMVNQEYSSW